MNNTKTELFEQKINVRAAKRRTRCNGFGEFRWKISLGLFGLIFTNAGTGLISTGERLLGIIILAASMVSLWLCYWVFKPIKENIWSKLALTSEYLILEPAEINPKDEVHIPLNDILFLKFHGASCSLFLEMNEHANKFWKSYQERAESDYGIEAEKKNIEIYADYRITMKESFGQILEKIGEIRTKELPYIL